MYIWSQDFEKVLAKISCSVCVSACRVVGVHNFMWVWWMYCGVRKKEAFPHCVILSPLSLLPQQSAAAQFPSVVLCLMAEQSGLSEFILSWVCVCACQCKCGMCARVLPQRIHGSVLVCVTCIPSPARCPLSSTQNQSALLPIRVTISKVAAHNDVTAAAVSEWVSAYIYRSA